MKYSERDLASAIDALLKKLKDASEEELEALFNEHPCIHEVNEFGADGPIGLGLGRFGGHAVG